MFDINTFNIRFQIGSIHHYFGRRLNFKISSQPCCLFQRRTSNGTDCIHYFMSYILKKQGKQISPCLCVHVHGCTHTHVCKTSERILSDLIFLELRALTQSFGNSPQFKMPYLKVSLVFFIFQTRVFHNKLIQNPKRTKEKKTKQNRKYQDKGNDTI